MACVSHGLIVGGGLGGLASAIALEQIGVHCDVAEIGDFRAVGAGMGIAGRAPNALQELGVYEEVAARSQPGLAPPTLYDSAGVVIAPPPPPPPPTPGALEALGAYRPAVADVLVARAKEMGAQLETNTSVEAIDDTDDGVRVTMTGGEVRTYDFLVGADGVNSRVRSLVFPQAERPAYAGQMSVRWMFPSAPMDDEGWYVAGEMGRMAFYHQPYPQVMYVPMVINMPKQRLDQRGAYELVKRMLEQYTAPAIVELGRRLSPDDEIIPRPFEWLLLPTWSSGRTVLLGDAAHATTAHLGLGGGMALEDGVVLAQCIAEADTVQAAYDAFLTRRYQRVKTVVETSVELSRREQANLPPGPETASLMGGAIAALSRPY